MPPIRSRRQLIDNDYPKLRLDTPKRSRILFLPDRDPQREPVSLPDDDPGGTSGWHKVGHEEKAHRKWRGHVGTFLAENLGKDISKAWHIDDFPPNYSLWRKRRKSRAPRYDWYIFGYGQKKRFNSPREFAFHAVWLYADELFESKRCECTLCTGRKQGEINRLWVGIPSRQSQRNEDDESEDDEVDRSSKEYRTRRREQCKLVRWVRSKRLLLGDHTASGAPEVAVNPQRDSDLASLRPFRKGELVWVSIPHLAPTIQDPKSPHELVEFWPALIRDVIHTPAPSSAVKSWQYSVLLLGVNQRYIVDEDIIIAWQLYKPSQSLRTSLSFPSFPFKLTPNLNGAASFLPMPQHTQSSSQRRAYHPSHEIPRNYKNALAALKIAYEVGRRIAEQWYMVDGDQDRGSDGKFPKMYQGLWFGPQLVWTDDLVRLEITRLDLEKQGINRLLPPSRGARDRCLFAHITQVEWDKQAAAPFISARLYELCDEEDYDSDDDTPLLRPSPPSTPTPAQTEAYSLPSPPPGFKFRRITHSQSELFLPAIAISSRYESTPSLSTPHRLLLSRVMTPQNVTAVLSRALVSDKYIEAAVRRITGYIGTGNPTWNVIWARHVVEDRGKGVILAKEDVRGIYYQKWKIRQEQSSSSAAVQSHNRNAEIIEID